MLPLTKIQLYQFVVFIQYVLKKTKIFGAKVKLGIIDLNGKPKKLPSTLRLKLEELSKKSIKI